MAELQELLASFTRVKGVTAAAIVGQDGLVLHSETPHGQDGVDVDALGALASSGLVSAQDLGRESGAGRLRQSIFEYDGGVVVVEPIGDTALLVITTDAVANLGLLRLTAKRLHPGVQAALADL